MTSSGQDGGVQKTILYISKEEKKNKKHDFLEVLYLQKSYKNITEKFHTLGAQFLLWLISYVRLVTLLQLIDQCWYIITN